MKESIRVAIHGPHYAPEKCGIQYFYKQNMDEHIFALHRHRFLEIEYVISGSFENELNSERFHLGSGDFYCLGLNDYHSLGVGKGGSLYSLAINYKNMPPVLQQLIKSVPFPLVGHFPEDERGEVEAMLAEIGRLIRSRQPRSEEMLTAYTILLLCKIFERASPLVTKKPSGSYRHITKAIDYIEEHYAEHITLEDVAKTVYLSPNHFSKLFSDMNGITFSDYLIRLRVDKARQMLLKNQKTVTEIALECGFSSFSAFSRNFKRICGYTPSEFRNEQTDD